MPLPRAENCSMNLIPGTHFLTAPFNQYKHAVSKSQSSASLPPIKCSVAPPRLDYQPLFVEGARERRKSSLGSSRLSTTAEPLFRCLNCAQRFDYPASALGSSRKLGGAAEHLLDVNICRLNSLRKLLKGVVTDHSVPTITWGSVWAHVEHTWVSCGAAGGLTQHGILNLRVKILFTRLYEPLNTLVKLERLDALYTIVRKD